MLKLHVLHRHINVSKKSFIISKFSSKTWVGQTNSPAADDTIPTSAHRRHVADVTTDRCILLHQNSRRRLVFCCCPFPPFLFFTSCVCVSVCLCVPFCAICHKMYACLSVYVLYLFIFHEIENINFLHFLRNDYRNATPSLPPILPPRLPLVSNCYLQSLIYIYIYIYTYIHIYTQIDIHTNR